MKSANITALAGSLLAAIGVFMPLATAANGFYFVSIQHLTGLPYMLYILPFMALAIATLSLYRNLPSARWWYISVASLGTIVAYISVDAARTQVSYLASSFGKLQLHGELGLGGFFILAGFIAIGVSGGISLGFPTKRKSRFNLNSN